LHKPAYNPYAVAIVLIPFCLYFIVVKFIFSLSLYWFVKKPYHLSCDELKINVLYPFNSPCSLIGILSNSPTLCATGAGINNAVRGYHDKSKGFAHPVHEPKHNRIVKIKPNADGPWDNTTNYNYPMSKRTIKRRPF
jgi:hypothetical protein